MGSRMMRRQARASHRGHEAMGTARSRGFVPAHTIPHYVTNQTTSRNAGALGLGQGPDEFSPMNSACVEAGVELTEAGERCLSHEGLFRSSSAVQCLGRGDGPRERAA
jgi:hypothetical protein